MHQLFKLYYLEQEIKELNKEYGKKRKELERQVQKKDEINASIKDHKQNHNKLSRSLATTDKDIREAELNLNKKRPAYIKGI